MYNVGNCNEQKEFKNEEPKNSSTYQELIRGSYGSRINHNIESLESMRLIKKRKLAENVCMQWLFYLLPTLSIVRESLHIKQ